VLEHHNILDSIDKIIVIPLILSSGYRTPVHFYVNFYEKDTVAQLFTTEEVPH